MCYLRKGSVVYNTLKTKSLKKESPEPDLDMAAMLELLGQELETTMNNMLRTQMERKKKGSMQEQTE